MNVRCIILSLLAVLVVTPPAAATQAQTIPIDRWLIAEAFGPDSASVSQLEIELLDPPGESGVLPDRGMPASGTTWHLHRHDGVAKVSLDSLDSTILPGSIIYAHAYARLPSDRNLRFAWDAHGCTVGRAWLNGREVAGEDIVARFGAGWNTILLKLEAGDCSFGYEATLSSDRAGDLDDVRLQASRPPGEVRTGPEPWVILRGFAEISPERRWSGDRLFAGIKIGLTGWGRSPISDVEVELRGMVDGKAEAPWLTPGEPSEVVVPVRLDRLQRIVDAGIVDSRISWEDNRIDRQLRMSTSVPEASDTIALDGWKMSRVTEEGKNQRVEEQVPSAAGWLLEGEWRVPEVLAGHTLELQVDGAPAEYVLNGVPTALSGEVLTLCSSCSKGTKLVLTVRTMESWDTMPIVRVVRRSDS